MSKATSRTLFLLGILLWVIGAVVFGMSPEGNKLFTNLSTNPNSYTSLTGGTGLMATGGSLVALLGLILILLAWIGGIIRTAVIGRWGWFIVLLIVGLILLPTVLLFLLLMLIYVFFGPTDRRVRRPVTAT